MIWLSWINLDIDCDGYAHGWVKVYNPSYSEVYGG